MRKVNLIHIFFLAVLCQVFPLVAGEFNSDSYERVTIISDLDDTIKITNTTDPWAMVGNALYSTNIFSGTDMLYRQMVPQGKHFFLLSASPTLLLRKVELLLSTHKMPLAEITLRNIITQRDKYLYKLSAVRKMIDSSLADEQFILIGDDSDKDPEVYWQIAQEYPEQVLAIYIHPVRGRDFSELTELKIFHTPLDIALYEEMAGRLSPDWIVKLSLRLIHSPLKLLYPHFMNCNQLDLSPSAPADHSRLANVVEAVRQQLDAACKK